MRPRALSWRPAVRRRMWLAVLGIFVFSFPSRQAQSLLGLAEGESCKDALEGVWTCTTLKKCSHVDVRILRPTICSFRGRDPIICCPPAKKMTKSEMSCYRFINEVPCPKPKLGEVHIAVVGGSPSKKQTQRQMAMIGYGPQNDKRWNCGGSLISDIWILSAAHCTNPGGELGVARWARLGELDQSSTTDDARPQDRRIVQRINHPEYKEPQLYHDVALYKLSSSVSFDQFVAPICLHTSFDIKEPKATVVGWGRTDFAGEVSSRLMEVDITLINHTECKTLYGQGDQTTPRGIDKLAMLCAGEKEGGKDACSGDSGGPLVINLPGSCLKKQVGITSFGRDCGLPNQPGIYTRVSTYVAWIESVVWP